MDETFGMALPYRDHALFSAMAAIAGKISSVSQLTEKAV
jgi:hypothetical protein